MKPYVHDVLRDLVKFRRERMTQKEAARRMNSTPPTLSRIETGRHNVSLGTLERYASSIGAHLFWQVVPHGYDYTVKVADLIAALQEVEEDMPGATTAVNVQGNLWVGNAEGHYGGIVVVRETRYDRLDEDSAVWRQAVEEQA